MRRRLTPLLMLLALLGHGASADAPKRLALDNGMRVIVDPNWLTEVVAIDLLLDISALDEPADKSGLRYLVQRLLTRGTKRQSGQAMARQLAAVGGVMDTKIGLDYVEIYALVPADGFEVALTLLAEAVRSPAFPLEEVASQTLAAQKAVRAARDDPFQETYLAFREGLYGDHPYGRPTFGAPSSLAALTRDDLVSFHAQHYRPNNAVLAICGGLGDVRAARAMRRAFGDWTPGARSPRRAAQIAPLASSRIVARELPVPRAHLILGFAAPPADDHSYYAIQVIDSLLSGGSSARLPRQLREDLGLVYHVSSFYPTLADESHLAIYAATQPYRLAAVKAAILDALSRLCEEPVPPEDLAQAKRYLLGSYVLSHQRMKHRAYAFAWYELLGLGADFEHRYAEAVQAVTAGEVQQTAQALLCRFVLAVTMPAR